MQRFKKIILPMQGHSKKDLHWLYNTTTDLEPPKIFSRSRLRFWFGGTGSRTPEKLLLSVEIPGSFLDGPIPEDSLPHEAYLLHTLAPALSRLSGLYRNADKDTREKAQFAAQTAGPWLARRSGIRYDREKHVYLLRLGFHVPLVNALSVNARAAVRAVQDICETIEDTLCGLSSRRLAQYITTYKYQRQIRSFMRAHGLCVFLADGSILPRENETGLPLKEAVPFVSPQETAVRIPLADGTTIRGMGIREGVTVITGGGCSGKSTLLDAIETGIYNHIPGDGREFVLTDHSALKIYAEDGRPVSGLDLSPFFRFLPGDTPLTAYTTSHASGSVSQAAGIVEAVCGGCRLLLMDEDKSAVNFMIRDQTMRRIVRDEPIIPFTDRVRGLYREKKVSTILVIGGSGEYLAHADTVLLMENFTPRVITRELEQLELPRPAADAPPARWARSRRLIPRETSQEFLYFRKVETENEKKILLDEYTADITMLTALRSPGQLNTLAYVMERLLTDKDACGAELLEKARACLLHLLETQGTVSLSPQAAPQFLEEIRPIDVFCCANRMRGLRFATAPCVPAEDGLSETEAELMEPAPAPPPLL